MNRSDYVIELEESIRTNREHIMDSTQMLIFTCLLILVILTIWLLKQKNITYVHETGLALVYGAMFGVTIRYFISNQSDKESRETSVIYLILNESMNLPNYIKLNTNSSVAQNFIYAFKNSKVNDGRKANSFEDKATFDPEIFFNIFLPPIIFNAGYSMKRKHFFKNFGAILMFAFFGTLISCFLTGGILYFILTKLITTDLNLKLTDFLFFGAIISATDPVSTLAIFNDQSVDLDLYSIVFGESVFNDVISIILAKQIEKYGSASNEYFDLENALNAIGNFCLTFSISFLIGALMGSLNALLNKYTQLKQHVSLETALFILISYTTFLFSEAIGSSGIVAVLFCGIFQAHYTYNNLSNESQLQTKQIFQILSFLSENFIFIYIGVTIFTFRQQHWNTWFIFASFIAICFSRAMNVYPLAFIINTTRDKNRRIEMNMQHLIFFSGLRGAMAFSLAIRNTSTEMRRLILTTCSIIVIVTVLFCGGLTKKMIEWLNIKKFKENYHEIEKLKKDPTTKAKFKFTFKYVWYNFDNKYMKPILTNTTSSSDEIYSSSTFSNLLSTNEQIKPSNSIP